MCHAQHLYSQHGSFVSAVEFFTLALENKNITRATTTYYRLPICNEFNVIVNGGLFVLLDGEKLVF